MSAEASVGEIVASLTMAQREALLGAELREARGAYRPEGLYVTADKRVRYNLAILRLLPDYLTPTQRLTPLGLAVREHLIENQRCDDCPPVGYPTDKTRCIPCDRRNHLNRPDAEKEMK